LYATTLALTLCTIILCFQIYDKTQRKKARPKRDKD
jgi:hypothetical protein